MKQSKFLSMSLAATKYILLLAAVLIGSASCERRNLGEVAGALVTVNVDWSRYGEDPGKMTVEFYRNGEGVYKTVVSPDVHSFRVRLPEGNYDIIAFNDRAKDFDCYRFNNANKGDEFGIQLIEGRRPKMFGVGGVNLVVPDDYLTVDGDPISIETDVIYPERVVWTMNVIANVYTLDQIKSLDGVISGLATGFGYGNADLTADYALKEWVNGEAENEISCSILCLGLPESWTGEADDNMLTFNFVLPNNSEVSRTLGVGNIMKVDPENKVLSVRVTTSVSEYQGGYDIDVEPWDDEKTL